MYTYTEHVDHNRLTDTNFILRLWQVYIYTCTYLHPLLSAAKARKQLRPCPYMYLSLLDDVVGITAREPCTFQQVHNITLSVWVGVLLHVHVINKHES